jgi:hypothetical protein
LVALPFLESLPAAAQTAPRRRFLAWFTPNGVNTAEWNLDGALTRLADSPTLSTLSPLGLFPRLTLVQGLSCLHRPPMSTGGHHRGVSGFLTAATCIQGSALKLCEDPPETGWEGCAPGGGSIDQLLARSLPRVTRFRSLELGPTHNAINGGECGGFPCAYLENISWIDGTTPAARETNPVHAFDRLFAGLDPGETMAAREKRRRQRLRVLDFVKDDADRLKARLGRDDHRRVDQYFSAITDLEDQIRAAPAPAQCDPGLRPTVEQVNPEDPTDYVRTFNRIMVLALQCDLTRVVTFMVGGGGNSGSYKYPRALNGRGPAPGGAWAFSTGEPSGVEQVRHHELSHWRNNEGFTGVPPSEQEFHAQKYRACALIDQHLLGLFGELLGDLGRTLDGPGGETLLDNTLAYYSSELSDGDTHSTSLLPILLAGGAAGALPGNRVITQNGTVADLFIAIAQLFGLPLARFGNDGTRPLPGVFG